MIHDEGWADYEIDRLKDLRLEEVNAIERDLIPCPHCAGYGRFANGNFGGKAVVCGKCGASSGYKDTEEEAALAWNARAERTCFADEVTHRDCKYSVNRGWRERTCEEYGSVRVWQSCNVWSHELSCGHEVDTLEKEPPNYCPSCGAKVVGE